ncbi:MAG: transporter [Proteobacteria bacterium]|nr:transporter [Pseudomonadota bacterium]
MKDFAWSTLARSTTALLLLLALVGRAALAAENGLSNFPYGAQTTYAAFVPAPGTNAFYGYSLYVNAGLRDGDGDKLRGANVEVLAFAPRFLHTWKSTLAGWNVTSGGLTELLYADVKLPGAKDQDLGPTLIGLEPLNLSRTIGHWTFFQGVLIYLPLGTYQPDKLANSNVNYRSYAYQASVTWLPTPRFEMSLNGAIEFKDENNKTHYEAGPQASITFGTGYKPVEGSKWDLGVSGYYTDGLADDERNGVTVAGGGRTRKFAMGPKVVYWLSPAAAIVAQWHHELVAENGTRGDLFWLECALPF